MSCKKIERFLAIFAIFPLLLSSAKTQPSIKNVIKSQDGVISLRFFLPDDRYGVLHHSNSLSEIGRPVSMVNGNNSIVQLHDEIGTNSNGFFRIRTYDKSDLSDIDNDGISDSIELDSLGKFNPLNPAAPISITSGRQFLPDQETFDSLSHRDNFPGSKDIREVKFLIFEISENCDF